MQKRLDNRRIGGIGIDIVVIRLGQVGADTDESKFSNSWSEFCAVALEFVFEIARPVAGYAVEVIDWYKAPDSHRAMYRLSKHADIALGFGIVGSEHQVGVLAELNQPLAAQRDVFLGSDFRAIETVCDVSVGLVLVKHARSAAIESPIPVVPYNFASKSSYFA